MVKQGNTVHMLYRYAKVSDYCDGKSLKYFANKIHYARLDTDENLPEDKKAAPLISATTALEAKGCEDPRIVEFKNEYYIFYSVFDGEICRVVMAKTKHFENIRKFCYSDKTMG